MNPDEFSDTPADGVLPPDDPRRRLTVADANSGAGLRHLALVGNVYTILIPGSATNGRYTLIEMRVPPGGGPPPHRHDFEEMFTVLEGRVRFTFRGTDVDVVAGATVNIPANAPHFFRNVSDVPARMLCMCTPAGQEEYFAEIGAVLDSPTDTPPPLTEAEESQQREKARQLAAKYRSELL
ncbi:cupin domain-containing protein [Nocardia sp. Marseille-Q1738]